MAIKESLGDYELLELVGKGGQGRVYKAFDTKLKRTVAIKVFHPIHDDYREKKLASFKYEARLASALNHPNICTVYALFEDDENTYTVMEYIEGKNLFELAYRRPLEIKSAVEIVLQIADALVAAHEKGIIHRDIKPRNVMVTETGQALVLDFGLAKLLEKPDGSIDLDIEETTPSETANEIFHEDLAEDLFVTVEGVAYGTPSSSPPEMARGQQTDERGDVYAVGGLLYLLLTGTYAFLGKTIKETREKVINEDPVPVSVARRAEGVVPLELIAIVRRALRKNPDERFQSMTKLRDALAAVLREINESAGVNSDSATTIPEISGPPVFAALPQPFWRKPAVILIFAAIIVLIVILACYVIF